MNNCKFCNSPWDTQNALHNHERQCHHNPEIWWTDDHKKLVSERTKTALKTASYSKIKVSCLVCRKEINCKQFDNHYGSKSCISFNKKKDHQRNKPNKEPCLHCGVNPRYSMSDHLSICRKNPENRNPVIWTEEKRKRHSDSMKRAVEENPDSYSKNNVCGRVKNIEYKDGIFLKGSWEVRTAEWLDSQGLQWENEANPQPYFWEDKWKIYFPDFYLPEYDCYIEVKGYRTDRDIAKWNYFKGDLLIFEKEVVDKLDDLSIEYAVEKFKWD